MASHPLTILVVEASDDLRTRIKTLLTQTGFRVHIFNSPRDALAALEKKESVTYALAVSGLFLPGMKGDAFLAQARDLSPSTRRILLADAGYIDTLIQAVNAARLHACITIPFQDQDLVDRVDSACRDFQAMRKQKHLERITRRQNRQLFHLAQQQKKADARNRTRLKERDRQIRVLRTKLKAAGPPPGEKQPPTLETLLEKMNLDFIPDRMASQFLIIREQVRQILETAVSAQAIRLRPLPYNQLQAGQPDDPRQNLTHRLLPPIFMLLDQSRQAGMDLFGKEFEDFTRTHFRLTIAQDRLTARLVCLRQSPRTISPLVVRRLLETRGITHGICDDTAIRDWLASATPGSKELTAAQGRPPVQPKPGQIHYHFPHDFQQPGKVNPDGSMDFTDRGDTPHITKGSLLATLTRPRPGTPGQDIYGNEIPLPPPREIIFAAGPGARLSKCGTRISATRDGQPIADPLVGIRVCSELKIDGDLGFETGDITFDGHVVVIGRVKQGFTIRAASLTALEVRGADIDLDGDLHVALGIVDTDMIDVRGDVRAKFIRNSRINALGDLIVQREITDSLIRISGTLVNPKGTLIASVISANLGVAAGHIGTDHTEPNRITIGVDDYSKHLQKGVTHQIQKTETDLANLEKKETDLKAEEMRLHTHIASQAHTQEKSEQELARIKSQMPDLRASGNISAFQRLDRALAKHQKEIDRAKKEIDIAFQQQDDIVTTIQGIQKQKHDLQSTIKPLEERRTQIQAKQGGTPRNPQLKVGGRIRSGTRIYGPHTHLILPASKDFCRIQETTQKIRKETVHRMEIASSTAALKKKM